MTQIYEVEHFNLLCFVLSAMVVLIACALRARTKTKHRGKGLNMHCLDRTVANLATVKRWHRSTHNVVDDPPCQIIVCEHEKYYRSAMRALCAQFDRGESANRFARHSSRLDDDDVDRSRHLIVEVGCHLGVTIGQISDRLRECARPFHLHFLGVDLSEATLNKARERFAESVEDGRLCLHVHDALDVSGLRALCAQVAQCEQRIERTVSKQGVVRERRRSLMPVIDAIFLDISGSRQLDTLVPLIERYENALRPKLIVVKSLKLAQLVSKLRLPEQYFDSFVG
jgi:ubiquinone/menaquinone biosynthesis C-methylase UbiE